MSCYMCLKTRSHTMKCGPSHTTTCTCHSEADAPWGRNLMLTTYQDRPPLCPFRLLPLLIYSGSVIAFLKIQRVKSPKI